MPVEGWGWDRVLLDATSPEPLKELSGAHPAVKTAKYIMTTCRTVAAKTGVISFVVSMRFSFRGFCVEAPSYRARIGNQGLRELSNPEKRASLQVLRSDSRIQ
jgi:hypothetical protein